MCQYREKHQRESERNGEKRVREEKVAVVAEENRRLLDGENGVEYHSLGWSRAGNAAGMEDFDGDPALLQHMDYWISNLRSDFVCNNNPHCRLQEKLDWERRW